MQWFIKCNTELLLDYMNMQSCHPVVRKVSQCFILIAGLTVG